APLLEPDIDLEFLSDDCDGWYGSSGHVNWNWEAPSLPPLRVYAIPIGDPNYLIMKSGQAEQHQTAKMGAAMVAAAFTNPLVESMASDVLPYPIDIIFYCGPRLHLII
ncbi:hypothetical protein FOZ63_020206, partial [Perkinsus olseni]